MIMQVRQKYSNAHLSLLVSAVVCCWVLPHSCYPLLLLRVVLPLLCSLPASPVSVLWRIVNSSYICVYIFCLHIMWTK